MGTILYLAPFIQTEWAVHGYPWQHPEPQCIPGIVHRLIVSDAVVYEDWTQSSHPDALEHYYLVILHDDGTQSTHEVSTGVAQTMRPLARWNCEPTTWSNRAPVI